jgi:AcrR family transcriptional regulator
LTAFSASARQEHSTSNDAQKFHLTVTIVSCNIRYMGERRDELIHKSLDYFLKNGVAGLSLRPLASEIGTSARLLVYHFGSKEGLINAVMSEVQTRIQESFAALASVQGKRHDKGVMRTFWSWTIRPENARYLRLLFEVQVLAIQNPLKYARYLENTSSNWLELIEASMSHTREKRIIATLCAAVIDGLLLEFLSTGDDRRTTKALEMFDRIMAGSHRTKRNKGGK